MSRLPTLTFAAFARSKPYLAEVTAFLSEALRFSRLLGRYQGSRACLEIDGKSNELEGAKDSCGLRLQVCTVSELVDAIHRWLDLAPRTPQNAKDRALMPRIACVGVLAPRNPGFPVAKSVERPQGSSLGR